MMFFLANASLYYYIKSSLFVECNYFSQACPWRDSGAVCDAGCNFTAVSIGSTFVNLSTEMGSWLNLRVACWNMSIRLSDSSLSLRPASLPERVPFQCSPSSSPSSYFTLHHFTPTPHWRRAMHYNQARCLQSAHFVLCFFCLQCKWLCVFLFVALLTM